MLFLLWRFLSRVSFHVIPILHGVGCFFFPVSSFTFTSLIDAGCISALAFVDIGHFFMWRFGFLLMVDTREWCYLVTLNSYG